LSAETENRLTAQPERQGRHGSVISLSEGSSPTSTFRSILFGDDADAATVSRKEPPEYFRDLNLDQIVDSITAGRDAYDLKTLFYLPLTSIDSIQRRQAVFRDLETPALLEHIQTFAAAMCHMRSSIAQAKSAYHNYQKDALFLSAVEVYCSALLSLVSGLSSANLKSRGFRDLRDYLVGYTESGGFRELAVEAESLRSDLNSIRYSLRIDGKRLTVGRCGDESDLSAEVLQTFEKFRQGNSKEYQFKVSKWPGMNHVEAAILDRVARLFPEIFARLEKFSQRHRGYWDQVIATFDREVQFYLASIEFRRRLERTGLPFCYPEITTSKDIHADDTFDLALADRLTETHRRTVMNNFVLKGPERVFVVSGPNQGGKTTFARMFGQLHHLGLLGCPVPGTGAHLFLFDQMFTHFERQEDLQNLSGKLEDELKRIHRILEKVTGKSILIMNESFGSTTLNDGLFLSTQIMKRIVSADLLCVIVTFLDELVTLHNSIVSMVSAVDPKDPALRTFKIVRKPADGLAYAAALAQKYRLTQDAIVERISDNRKRVNRS
jgi:DNA mismatch repair protein MutS